MGAGAGEAGLHRPGVARVLEKELERRQRRRTKQYKARHRLRADKADLVSQFDTVEKEQLALRASTQIRIAELKQARESGGTGAFGGGVANIRAEACRVLRR